jgi:hypothetical protein
MLLDRTFDPVAVAIRAADGTGRHTTTVREMHRLDRGGWLLDTPGMRELQLPDAATGISEVFDDILLVAQGCRFSDCAHGSEPGCAVREAIARGQLDADRLASYEKLLREMRYQESREDPSAALDRKRRMRLLYKWRHGLEHTHQPHHRDRGKLRLLADIEAMKLDDITNRIIAPIVAYWERQLYQ